MPNNQQKEEVKCEACRHIATGAGHGCGCPHTCKPTVTPDPEPPEKDVVKPESMVTTLEEDRKRLDLKHGLESYIREALALAELTEHNCVHVDTVRDLLAAKERVVRAECASRVTRRIRIWEHRKCIISIDIQGDTIVPRLNKKNLKVTYEAFNNDLSPNYSIEKIIKKDNTK